MDEAQLRDDLCEIGRRLWLAGMAPANAGNLSARLGGERLICTPTGVSKGFMKPTEMVVTDLQGRLLSEGVPSSELQMHLEVYRQRPEIRGVVHVHPPVATGFAASKQTLPCDLLTEVLGTVGEVPTVPLAVPGTAGMASSLAPYLADHEAFLLANHGALTIGRDVWQAYFRMEIIEHAAQVTLVAEQLGGAVRVPAEAAALILAGRG